MYYQCFKKYVILVSLLLLAQTAFASGQVDGVRIWASPESTRVVLDLSSPIQYKTFTLDNPNRVVIDIQDAKFKGKLDQIALIDSGITQIRHSQQKTVLRLVLDMQAKTSISSFLVSPNQKYGHRLVLDLSHKSDKAQTSKSPKSPMADFSRMPKGEFIVAIDPGHGGEDSGAVGRHKKLKEKDIVLAVSKRLQKLINAQRGMRSFLIRSGDYYVSLRKRMELARQQGADLFISVHADSFSDVRAKGASVFILSEKGASSEAARWLAERENRSDLIGGVKLEDKSSLLASVLLDLSQTASQSASQELASHLIFNLGKITDLHYTTVQRAGFMVLKSPDIPSVLVELGFISNLKGEQKLSDSRHQQALATALLSGVKMYLSKRTPPIKHPYDWTVAKKSTKKTR